MDFVFCIERKGLHWKAEHDPCTGRSTKSTLANRYNDNSMIKVCVDFYHWIILRLFFPLHYFNTFCFLIYIFCIFLNLHKRLLERVWCSKKINMMLTWWRIFGLLYILHIFIVRTGWNKLYIWIYIRFILYILISEKA